MEPSVYHERQAAALCGVHALNSLVQYPAFGPGDLADIAAELDAEERALMMENGTETKEAIMFVAEGSGNVDESGNFSVSVLAQALRRKHHLELVYSDADVEKAIANPTAEQAYVLNLEEHWYTIRKLHGMWWDLNSLLKQPQRIGELYLGAMLAQLRTGGYSIFIVRGKLPPLIPPGTVGAPTCWHSVAGLLTRASRPRRRSRARSTEEEDVAAAIAASLAPGGGATAAAAPAPVIGDDDDDDDEGDDEADDLAMALALSMSASEAATGRVPAAPASAADSEAASLALARRLNEDMLAQAGAATATAAAETAALTAGADWIDVVDDDEDVVDVDEEEQLRLALALSREQQ